MAEMKRGWYWRPRFLRPRFSLWAMLVLVTVVAIPLSYVAQRRSWNLRRKAAYERFVAKEFLLKPQAPPVVVSTSPPTGDPFGDDVETKPWIDWRWIGAQWERLCLDNAAPPLQSFFATDARRGGPFEEYQVNDQDLGDLALFPELNELRLWHCDLATDRGLEVITRLPRLETLDIHGVPNVRGDFLNHRQQPIAIKKLHLGGENFGDEEIIRWLSHMDMEELSFGGKYTRGVAPALARQTGLKVLKLVDSPLIDEDFAFLAKCSQLETLELEVMAIRGDFLERIAAPERLEGLSLNCTLLNDENLAAVVRFTNLISLEVEFTPISGKGFQGAAFWPATYDFSLKGTELSGEGKAALGEIHGPKHVLLPMNWAAQDSHHFEYVQRPWWTRGPENESTFLGGSYPWDSPLWNRGPKNCSAEELAPVLRLHELMRDRLREAKILPVEP